MKHDYTRVCRFALLLVAAVMFLPAVEAKQPDRSPGAYIPLLKNARVDELTATRWVEGANGAYLEVFSGPGEAWAALDLALTNLGVKPVKKDTASRQWVTDWVVWKYNKKKGTGRSKPAFSFTDNSLERHQFMITVRTGSNREHAVIIAVDKKREKEVDLTPDSEASWLEWKPRNLQQGAADTFLQRLQLPIESALATEFVVEEEITRTTTGDLVVTETAADTSTDVALITIPEARITSIQPQTSEAPPVASDEAVRESGIAEAEINENRQPVKGAQKTVDTFTPAETIMSEKPLLESQPTEIITHKSEPAGTGITRSQQSAQRPQETLAAQPQTMPVEETRPSQSPGPPVVNEPSAAPVSAVVPLATTPAPTKNVIQTDVAVTPSVNGLLVRAAPAVAWPALLKALHDLEIPIDREDGAQHLLTTGWVNANYDEKNHQLVLRSEDKPRWAFSFFGKGIERQQYKVVLVPANKGARSIIYAYNTGYQQQIDQTPDSSQTLLAWEDRDTSPDLALAFLRQLRIVIPH